MLRSSSVPVPLRVLALFIVVSALVLTTLATALADQHPAAADGQRLEDQSAEVQALYRAVYGDDAEARWIAEHNAAIGASMMMDDMMMDSMDPMSSPYYDRIVAAAIARGAGMMDMDLPHRIAADVISRGTEEAFLAGTDAGVLYGIGPSEADINAPPSAPAAAAPSGGGGGGGGGTAAPAGGTGLFLRVPAIPTRTLLTSVAIADAIVLPEASVAPPPGYDPTEYTVSGLPSGLSVDTTDRTAAAARTITGTPNYAGEYTVSYMASQKDGDPTDDGENNADKKPELRSTMTFTLIVAAQSAPEFDSNTLAADGISLLAGSGMWETTLPGATKGNGDLVYSATLPDGTWLKFDKDSRGLSGTVPTAAGTQTVTYSVADSDVDTADSDAASITFTITVNADSKPVLPAAATIEAVAAIQAGATVGLHYSAVLPEATGGVLVSDGATSAPINTPVTYSVSGLPSGLSFNADNRTINGVPNALPTGVGSQVYQVKYMAEDDDGDEASAVTFNLTVNG